MHRLRIELLESRITPAFMSFRAGDGFTVSDDTFIGANLPQSPQQAATQLEVSGSATATGERQALLRFPNLFGNGSHQIPTTATIRAATITLFATSMSTSTVPIQFFRNLTTWNANLATWDYFADGLQVDNTELETVPIVTQTMTSGGYQVSSQLIADRLIAWQSGVPNGGWAILAGNSNAHWSFASGDEPDHTRRPLLSVEYTAVGEHNPNYAELSGQPPSPLKSAWFDWANDLRQRRLDRVPTDRSSTFYFAQNGNDETGWGTIDQPWKSVAKANELLLISPIDLRLRFRRGDVWRETSTLQIYSDGITVDDYGDANLARPLFTRFQPVATNDWVGLPSGVYHTSGFSTVGWLREAADGFARIYYRADSLTEVESRIYSWWYDDIGNEPASSGQPTLYVNANGSPASILGGLEVAPGDGKGWTVDGDNNRLQNLRLEGQGMARDGFGYGLKVVHRGQYWEFVGQNLDIYYTGYHSFGQIGQYLGTTSVVTLVNVKAGFCTNRFGNGAPGGGDITVFVSYADWGGNEYYQYDCEAVSGALPSADWAPQLGMKHGTALYTHVGQGGQMRLLLCWKTAAGLSYNPVASINILDNSTTANTLDDVRGYIVEDRPGPIASWWQKQYTVSINNILDQQSLPAPYNPYRTLMYYGPFQIGGFLINCTAKIDARFQFNGRFDFLFGGQDSTKYINCHLDISNAIMPSYFRNEYLDPYGLASAMTVTNTIISIQSSGETGVNAVNDAQHLSHNAYYLPNLTANVNAQYTGDPGAVTLPQRFAAGMIPSPSNPIFNGGFANGLEYDQNRQPRGTRRTIGPLAGALLPTPTDVRIGWGVRTMSLDTNSIVPSNRTDRIFLAFPDDVDVKSASLRLWSASGAVTLGGFNYQSTSRTATWTLNTPLSRGTYILEVDSQPIKGFHVLPGDFDGDGSVAASDFILFRLNFGGTGFDGDFDGDGAVGATDFITFRLAFGSSL